MRGTNGAVVVLAGVAALAGAAGCGPTTRPHASDETPSAGSGSTPASPFLFASGPAVHAIARDDQWLYWSDSDGVHRRKLGDAAGNDRAAAARELFSKPGKEGDPFPDLLVLASGGGALVGSDGNTVYTFAGKGAPPHPLAADLGNVVALAVAGDTVIVARVDSIVKMPLAGGAVTTLVAGQRHVGTVAVDADHVYWSDYGEEPQFPPPPGDEHTPGMGSIRRVALTGGKVEELAAHQRGPGSVAVSNGRVYWSCDRLPALQSAHPDGSDRKLELNGTADRMAIDRAGAVVRTPQGYLLEMFAGHHEQVRGGPDGTFQPTQAAPVLADGWLYALATRNGDGSGAVLAIPRDGPAPVIAIDLQGSLTRMRARGGMLYWLESRRDGNGVGVWRGDPRTGARRSLIEPNGQWSTDLTVGADGTVYVVQDSQLYQIPARGGPLQQFAQAQQWISSVVVHHDHVFWVDGTALLAKRRSGGDPITVARSPTGYSNGDSGGDIVFDDDYAYVTNFGTGSGVTRISEQGQIELLWDGTGTYPGRDIVKLGDELYFWAGYTVYHLPLDGSSASPLYRLIGNGGGSITDLVSGAGYLFAVVGYGDAWELIRIDPAGGDARTVLRWGYGGNDQGQIAADDSGVYVSIDALGAILHVPVDAPPLPAAGWPRS